MPEVSERTRKAYDSLLEGDRALTHKQTRQVVEQMEAHGWELTSGDAYGMTVWTAPDGRKQGVQFFQRDKAARMASPNGQSDMTFKAALANVVTPHHEEVSGPNIISAAKKVAPELDGPLNSRFGSGQMDPSISILDKLIRQHAGIWGAEKKSLPEVLKGLRDEATQRDKNADDMEAHNRQFLGGGTGKDARSELLRKRADQFRAIASEMENMQRERTAYEAERDRRAVLPLDIRPGRPGAGSAKPKQAGSSTVAGKPADIAGRIVKAQSREDAYAMLDGLTIPQLKEVAANFQVGNREQKGITLTGATKDGIRRDIVEFAVGRSIDSDVITRTGGSRPLASAGLDPFAAHAPTVRDRAIEEAFPLDTLRAKRDDGGMTPTTAAKPASKLTYIQDATLRKFYEIERRFGKAPGDTYQDHGVLEWRKGVTEFEYGDEMKKALGDQYLHTRSAGATSEKLEGLGLLTRKPLIGHSELTEKGRQLVESTSPPAKPEKREVKKPELPSNERVQQVMSAVVTADQARALGFEVNDAPVNVGDEVMVDTFGKLRGGIVTHVGTKNVSVAYMTPSGGYTQTATRERSTILRKVGEPERGAFRAAAPKLPAAPKLTEEERAAAKLAKAAQEKADRDKRNAEWTARRIGEIRTAMAEGNEDRARSHLVGTTPEGLRALARELGVKTPRGLSDREKVDHFRRAIVEAARPEGESAGFSDLTKRETAVRDLLSDTINSLGDDASQGRLRLALRGTRQRLADRANGDDQLTETAHEIRLIAQNLRGKELGPEMATLLRKVRVHARAGDGQMNTRQRKVIDRGASWTGNPYTVLKMYEELTDDDFAGLSEVQKENLRFVLAKLKRRIEADVYERAGKLEERFGTYRK